MKFILVLITIVALNDVDTKVLGVYNTMEECFDAREAVVELVGRPIQNYQAVCIINTK